VIISKTTPKVDSAVCLSTSARIYYTHGRRQGGKGVASLDQGRNQDFAKGGLENGKFLRRHFDDVF